jgi:hypothetical protein
MKRFRSRVSIVLLLFVAGSLAPAFILESNTTGKTELFIAYSVLFGSMALVVGMLFSMNYVITESSLFVRLGFIKLSEIKIADIQIVERSYNPLSSPAASLKRLYVKGKGKDTLISPNDEQEFIRILKSRNPKISVNINDNSAWWKFWNWDI